MITKHIIKDKKDNKILSHVSNLLLVMSCHSHFPQLRRKMCNSQSLSDATVCLMSAMRLPLLALLNKLKVTLMHTHMYLEHRVKSNIHLQCFCVKVLGTFGSTIQYRIVLRLDE